NRFKRETDKSRSFRCHSVSVAPFTHRCPTGFPSDRRRLHGHGQWFSLSRRLNDLARERRPRRSGELDIEILTEHRSIAWDQHRLEVTRARLPQLTTAACFFFDEHLVPFAELLEIRRARDAAHRFNELR